MKTLKKANVKNPARSHDEKVMGWIFEQYRAYFDENRVTLESAIKDLKRDPDHEPSRALANSYKRFLSSIRWASTSRPDFYKNLVNEIDNGLLNYPI